MSQLNNHPVPRKICVDLTALYQGQKYYFPDALPGQTVFFVDGQPESKSAVKVNHDEFGFDELPLGNAASTNLFRNPHHKAHNQSKTGRWGSLNKWRGRLSGFSKRVLGLIPGQQNNRIAHINDGGEGHAETMPYQAEALMSASGADNAGTHK